MKLKLSTVVGTFVLIAAAAASFAAAATLSMSSRSLGAGRAAVSVCDSDGFSYTHTLDASQNVATVTVSGIAASCAGTTLQLTLADAGNASIGSASALLPASGFLGQVTLTITGAAPSANVSFYRVAVTS